jgi:hypothetical protein
LKHLKSLYTFVLADFEQQFNPALATASAVVVHYNATNKNQG